MNIARMHAEQIRFGEKHGSTSSGTLRPGELTTEYWVKEEREWMITLQALGVGVLILVYLVGFYLIIKWQEVKRWKLMKKRD